MSTEPDKTEATMYFYGSFHYKVLMYITGSFCARVVQNVCFYKRNTFVHVLYVSVIPVGGMVNLGNFC